jgi:hypothetical protein
VRQPVPSAVPFAAPTGARTIYLNRKGGTYNIVNGATNAATNTANTIAAGDGRTHSNAVIPPLESSFDWPYIVDCVKKQYKKYNVTITETEPTSGNYVEAVVGGNGASTGWSASSGILGVASADNFCGVTERGIAFSFASNHIGITKPNDELCATVAHEVGHLLALEHEIAAPDTMSYVPFASSGSKAFTDGSSHCGTDSQSQSSCSCQTTGAGEVTSSGVRLTQFLGLRPTETVPPTLAVSSPGDQDKLRPSFEVDATASDETQMDQVAVLVDGVMAASSSSPQGNAYTVAVANVAEGSHMLEVQAIDLAGNITKKQLAVTVALGNLGDTCAANEDCHGALCASDEDGTFCTQACSPDNACPGDFSCVAVGAQSVCTPDSGGGCNAGGNGHAMLGLLIVGLLARRRARG